LSADSVDEESTIYAKRKSQLNVIFSVLGTPQEAELQHLDVKSIRDIRTLKPRAPSVSQ
jgi:hypothetical protein